VSTEEEPKAHHRSVPEALHDGAEKVGEVLYSVGEEVAHAVTHGLGAVAGIVGLVVLVAYSVLYGDIWHVVSSCIFGASLILLYTSSTLYHGIPIPRAKQVLRVLDHSAIYLLIAGTYTPFLLVTFRETFGWYMFAVMWTLALAGVCFKIFATGKFEKTSVAIYIGMGWIIVLIVKPFLAQIPMGGVWLMVAGGLAYTVGVVFYVWKKLPYNHAIWHLFVLAGSVFHYLAVLLYVIPGPPEAV